MDREAVVVGLSVALTGAGLWCGTLVAARSKAAPGPSEGVAWRRLWLPLSPAAMIFTALLGWAVRDPDRDETLGLTLPIVAVLVLLVVARAMVRAWRAARPSLAGIAAGTVGVLSPRIVVAAELASSLDARALKALLAHEQAHARHRDPLRLLLARVATDLQWPFPGANRRLREWRAAMEIARDDEALLSGVDGADLAHAIVACAKFSQRRRATVAAAADSEELVERVERLLRGTRAPSTSRPTAQLIGLLTAHFGALVVGMLAGESLLRSLRAIVP